MNLLHYLYIFLSTLALSQAYSSGTPYCTAIPGHPAFLQESDPNIDWSVRLENDGDEILEFIPGYTYQAVLSGDNFEGFLAYILDEAGGYVDGLTLESPNGRFVECGATDGWTHLAADFKTSVEFSLRVDRDDIESITVFAVVVKDPSRHWWYVRKTLPIAPQQSTTAFPSTQSPLETTTHWTTWNWTTTMTEWTTWNWTSTITDTSATITNTDSTAGPTTGPTTLLHGSQIDNGTGTPTPTPTHTPTPTQDGTNPATTTVTPESPQTTAATTNAVTDSAPSSTEPSSPTSAGGVLLPTSDAVSGIVPDVSFLALLQLALMVSVAVLMG